MTLKKGNNAVLFSKYTVLCKRISELDIEYFI